MDHGKNSLNSMAISATLHCLTGCAVGEIIGMMIGAALGLGNGTTVVLSTGLAFLSGYSLSTLPLIRAGVGFMAALSLVFAADTLSILTMEVVDNLTMVVIPGALDAGLLDGIFWLSLALSLIAAFIVAFPVNRYLLAKGKGHALTHKFHHSSHEEHVHHD